MAYYKTLSHPMAFKTASFEDITEIMACLQSVQDQFLYDRGLAHCIGNEESVIHPPNLTAEEYESMIHVYRALVLEACEYYKLDERDQHMDNFMRMVHRIHEQRLIGWTDSGFNPEWVEEARRMYDGIFKNMDRRLCRFALALDPLIRSSGLFYDMVDDERIIGFLIGHHLDAPIESTTLVRGQFSSYFRVMQGRASMIDWFYAYRNGKQDLKNEAIDAGLAYGLYRESPTLTTAFLLLLQRIHRYFDTTVILKDVIELAKRMVALLKNGTVSAYSYVKDRIGTYMVPQHQTQGEIVRNDGGVATQQVEDERAAPLVSTNDTRALLDDTTLKIGDFLSEFGEGNASIVSLFVGIVFACVAASLGMSAYLKDTNSGFLKKIGSVGLNFAGVSRGIDGLINLANKFQSLVEWCMAYFLGKNEKHKILATILQCGVEDQDGFRKQDYMEHVKFITDPKNLHAIHASDEHKFIVEKCDEVANVIMTKVAAGELSVSRDTLAWFGYIRSEVKKLRQGIHRYPKVEPQRFVPYWINISGDPGVGKSVIIGDLAVYLSQCMYAAGSAYGFKSVPENDIFNKNFADKFMPGYNGQNILTIDDVFQDASVGAVDQSSAIQLINYISSVPYQPVQASIDEKGMPFTSKLVLTSTNSELPVRMEITNQEALLTRIRRMIRVTWKTGVCGPCKTTRGVELCAACQALADPELGRPINFTLLRLDNTSGAMRWVGEQTITWAALKLKLLSDFIVYWKHQTRMLERGKGSMVDDAAADVIRRLAGVDEPDIASTGLISFCSNAVSSIGGFAKEYVIDRPMYGWEAFKRACKYDVLYNELKNDARLISIVAMHAVMAAENSYRTMVNNGKRQVAAYQLCIPPGMGGDIDVQNWIAKFNEELKAHARMLDTGHEQLRIEDILSEIYNSYIAERDLIWREASGSLVEMWNMWTGSVLGAVLASIMTVFVSFIGFKAVSAVRNKICGAEGDTGFSSTSIKYNNGPSRVRAIKIRPAQLASTSFVSAGADPVTNTLINSMEQHDTICKIRIHYERDGVPVDQDANGVRIRGTYVLMNAHHVDNVPDGAYMEIQIPGVFGTKTVKQEFNSERVIRFDCGRNIDAVIYECDSKMPHAKDIVRHFLTDEMEAVTVPALLYTAGSGKNVSKMIYCGLTAKPVKWHYESYLGSSGVRYSVLGFYELNYATDKGVSGSLLMTTNARMTRKILGIQVATAVNGSASYVQPITEQMIEAAIGERRVIEEPDIPEIYSCCKITEVGEPPANLCNDGLRYIGKIPKSQQMTMAKKTKYEPSLIFDPENVTQEPSVLNNHDERMDPEIRGKNVLFRNLEKFDKAGGLISTAILAMVTAWLSAWYSTMQKMAYIAPRLLTDFEMVNGCEPLMKQFDMRTSPGYPYVKEREIAAGRGKFEWFDEKIEENGKKVYFMKDRVRARVEERERAAQEGRRIPTIAYACLKDETRAIEKIRAGKTRVFLCMPMDYNLLTRKYFGAFIMMMHERAAIHVPSCVGIDPCVGWTALARRLKSVGLDCEDFDYGGWDTQIHPQFMESFVEIVNAWYDDGEQNAMVRRVIVQELAHTFFIAQDRLFRKDSGTCSGFALTAECNSIINELIMVYCWVALASEHAPEMCNMESFLQNCAIGVYGDDIVKSVSEDATWFNGNNIKPIVEELGMDITAGDKSDGSFEFKALEDLTFLKRSFRPVGYDEYMAPLRKDIIENIPQWVHKSDDPATATNVNVMTAARNYALWGKDDYDEFTKRVNSRIAAQVSKGQYDLAPICVTWKEMMRTIYDEALMI